MRADEYVVIAGGHIRASSVADEYIAGAVCEVVASGVTDSNIAVAFDNSKSTSYRTNKCIGFTAVSV